MLAEWTTGTTLQVLAITIPIVALLIGFIWKWQEKQDTKLAKTCTRTTVLETKTATHKEELDKGTAKFEGIAAQVGHLQQESAATGAKVEAVQTTQSAMDTKLDELLARGGSS